MNVLIVCSGNVPNFDFKIHQSFVYEQISSVSANFPNVKYSIYIIKGKGVFGYLKNIKLLRFRIKNENIEIVHAHYSFSGLLSFLSTNVPIICTFHGSDIHYFFNRLLSYIVTIFCNRIIYVSDQLYNKALIKRKKIVIPCGVDTVLFSPISKMLARKKLFLNQNNKYILFPSSFDNLNKNYNLLKKACEIINDPLIHIIELKGYSRKEVAILMNAIDCLVVTSYKESGPLVIKEAMSVNKCAVSVNVGDVKQITTELNGYFISSYDSIDLAKLILKALAFNQSTNGRDRIFSLGLDSKTIASRIYGIYNSLLE